MIKQQAFTGKTKMLKGGLHCHTTRSDGDGTPEEVIRLHASKGYDFMTLTDHRIYNFKNYAPDVDITIIPGMEIDSTFERSRGFRTYHTVCLGKNDDSNGYSQDEEVTIPQAKTQEDFQKTLDAVHAKNNITFYCHPEWSSTPTRYFDRLEGEFGMEIWNSGCALGHKMDTNNAVQWDELLGMGKIIWGIAVDDGHDMGDHCNGWVMVNSENNVPAILEALQNGSFYSSCGPVIKDFYVDDDGIAHVETENDDVIVQFCADKQPYRLKEPENCHAELDLKGNFDYIRVSVIDKDGKRAWTNPIFLDGRK